MYHNAAEPQATIPADELAYLRSLRSQWFWLKRILIGLVLLATAILGGCPQYKVYAARAHGQAKLAEAESSRRVQVAQASGEKDAAVMRAQAIAIVGKAAQDFPEYRRQEFIGAFAEALKEGKINQIMYVPTEAGIPVTEAHRLVEPK